MPLALHICGCVLMLTLAGCAVWLARDVHELLQNANTDVVNLSATIQSANDALTAVNHDCAPGPCGTIATLNKTITKVGDAVVTTQLQERQATPHVVAAMDAFKESANALAGTAQAGTLALGTMNSTLQDFQAPLAAFTASGQDLDTLIKYPAIPKTLDHVEQFTLYGAGVARNAQDITGSAALITDHLEKVVDKPQPTWKAIIPGAELGGKLWACLAYHVCVN